MFLHCQYVSLSGEIQPIDTSGWGGRIQDAGLKVAFKQSWSDTNVALPVTGLLRFLKFHSNYHSV